MPRTAAGSVYRKGDHFHARISLAKGSRPSFTLPTCADEPAADVRAQLLAGLAGRLLAARVDCNGAKSDGRKLLAWAAQREGDALEAVLAAAETVCKDAGAKQAAAVATFRKVAERWTSGELAAEYPDQIRDKKTSEGDAGRLKLHVYPHVPDVPIAEFTLDHAERIMQAIPKARSRATRRHVAQLLHKILAIAVFPLRILAANPLPRGFLPKLSKPGSGPAKGWIYPSEDARLMAESAVPLCWRIFWGFLHREGPRTSEAAGLAWAELDLDAGAVRLDENKTDDPRWWDLAPGVAAALRAWRAHREATEGKLDAAASVFVNEKGQPFKRTERFAEHYREHLAAAAIDRPELTERTKARRQIRAHDARGAFVTVALANGRSESWISDRTGHKSSTMIATYKRAARTAAELRLGNWQPLDRAIPSLVPAAQPRRGGSEGGEVAKRSGERARPRVARRRSAASRSPTKSRLVPKVGLEPTSPLGQRILKARAQAAQGREGSVSRGLRQEGPDPAGPPETPFATSIATSTAATPRASILEALLAGAAAAAAAGDMEAARIAHEAAGRLLAPPPGGPDAEVLDLEQARRRRGR